MCHSRSGYQWGCLFCIAKDCSFYCSPLPIILLSAGEQKEINIRSSRGHVYPSTFDLLAFSSFSLSLSLSQSQSHQKEKDKKARERFENKFFTHLGPRVFLEQRKRDHEIARTSFPLVRLFYGTTLVFNWRLNYYSWPNIGKLSGESVFSCQKAKRARRSASLHATLRGQSAELN